MFGILFAKTFFLVGMMLVITTITTRINKAYETTAEMVLTILGTFGFLFAITFFSHIFPLNLLLVACFAGVVGWSMGPTITFYGRRFKLKRFLKARNIKTKKDSEKENVVIYYKESAGGDIEVVSEKELDTLLKDFEVEIEKGGDPYDKKWQDIVFQAMLGTALAVFASAALVSVSDIDFSFLGMFLFIALLLLIAVSLLNTFFFKSSKISLLKAYFGVLIFTLYLIFDFQRLESLMAKGETSWSAAIDIAVNLYLDIINLFLDLLYILADG
jgi:FtsH-binding integral membrane protein